VRTKADLITGAAAGDGHRVCALRGDGIVALGEHLAGLAFGGVGAGAAMTPVLTRERQRLALRRARDEVAAFAAARTGGIETAVAATHLRAAVTALESVIGIVTPDDVLARVFSTFCVGK
jgi:tRNA modification GTPase